MVEKKRCSFCNKKLGMIIYNCQCGGEFCAKHRYTHTHNCSCKKEKISQSKEKIQKLNPKTESTKLVKIG